PRAFNAALYAFQFVVRYLTRPQLVSLISRAYLTCDRHLCNNALRSRKPEARKFAKWVTSEVLPSIRQTGSYGQPAYDPDQVALAHRAALVATAQVYQSVFEAVMQGKDWQLNRYMLRFDVTAEDGTVARVKAVDRNAYVLPLDRFHSAVEDSICVDAQTLTQLASTCTARLGRMAARNAVAAPQQGSLQLR
ncbi:Bro-N domain-containing protein, partial [Comamonas aquatica]|uniref:BRO-N domain-containing protein n=1 Tax=Comamonas aquatica TaxID=225991 RepID=UPI003B982226